MLPRGGWVGEGKGAKHITVGTALALCIYSTTTMDSQTRQEMEALDFSPHKHPRTFRRDYNGGSGGANLTSHSHNRRRNKNYKQLIIDESRRLASKREQEKQRLQQEQQQTPGHEDDDVPSLPVDFDGPTFINIEAPPSLMPRKHYCDITGLSGPYKLTHSGLRYHNKEIYKAIQQLTPGVDQQYLELRNANVVLR